MQYLALLISAVLVGIDQLTKWLITSNMELQDTIPLIKFGDREVLNISYYVNDGAAFSKFGGQTTMLIVVTSAVLITLIVMLLMKKVKRTPYIMSFALIIGGGIGNLIDRVFNDGLVVDFIDFRIIHFAIFNFADICAVCGAGLLLLLIVLDEIKDFRAKKAAQTEGASENAEQTADVNEETNGAQSISTEEAQQTDFDDNGND